MQNNGPDPARSIIDALGEQYGELKRKAGDDNLLFSTVFVSGKSLTVEQIGTVQCTDFIYIAGFDEDGYDYRLIQHYSQVNILFTFMPVSKLKPEERRPIGFLVH
jgi:hypothetical protein